MHLHGLLSDHLSTIPLLARVVMLRSLKTQLVRILRVEIKLPHPGHASAAALKGPPDTLVPTLAASLKERKDWAESEVSRYALIDNRCQLATNDKTPFNTNTNLIWRVQEAHDAWTTICSGQMSW